MLVIADQRALRVGGKRGLAGPGQAEEDRGVAVGADIGRAVHRHYAALGQIIIQRGEYALLHLAGVVRPADQHDLAREIDRDHVLGTHAVAFGIGAEARQIDHGQFGHEAREVGRIGADQQGADEEGMPGKLGEDAGLDAEGRIGAAIKILREQRHAFGMLEEILVECFELLRGDRLVAGPPHVLVSQGVANGELVLWAAAGEHAGVRAQRAIGCQHGFARAQRVLVELRRAEIPVYALEFFEAGFVGAEGTVMHARLLHEEPPRTRISPARKPLNAPWSR